MGRRRLAFALALAALVVAAGCAAPTQSSLESDATTPTHPGGTPADPDAPADPETDVLGWENGYWHDESIDVDQSDGLSESEIEAVVGRAMARVEELRRIEFEMDVPVDVISRDELEEYVGAGPTRTRPAAVDVRDVVYEALFLVGERESGTGASSNTTESAVTGFYLPAADRIFLVSDGPAARVTETTLGHELVHALQSRTFGTRYGTTTIEGRNAVKGLIEGDARYVENRYRDRCGETWSCVGDDGTTGTPADDGGSEDGATNVSSAAPHRGLAILKYFPYSDGPGFVGRVRARGGWEAVNALYDDPPASAEQVAVPSKYGVDAPTEVRVPDRSGPGWRRVRPANGPAYESVGVAGITAMVAYPAYDDSRPGGVVPPDEFLNLDGAAVNQTDPIDYTTRYASGWDGDRIGVYTDGERTGYVWRLTWDSRAEAAEFASGYRELLAYWGGERASDRPGVWRIESGEFADAFRITVAGDTVTVVNAPDVAALDAVHAPER